MIYNNPHWTVSGSNVVQGDKSSIGDQIRLDVFIKRSLEDAAKRAYFSQMSGSEAMPKNMGKTIKKFKYIPLLDDSNNNNQGLDGSGNTYAKGNLYGGSRDITDMAAKMPKLTELGGKVNRVGFTRVVLESKLQKMGFYYDFTQEALDFDSDAEMLSHMGREAINAAHEIQEDMLGMELVQGAGIQKYTGAATNLDSMSGEDGVAASVVTYKDLQNLATSLKENRAPMQLKAVMGSRIIDTKIVGSGYVLFAGLAVENQLRNMVDAFSNPAFIPVEKYAQGDNTLVGEIGAIGQFRIVINEEMPEHVGKGASASGTGKASYRNDGSKYNVYPLLAMASEAFTTVGFQTGPKGTKFKMITKLPSTDIASISDPYGLTGFTSIQWYHSTLIDRPEWVGCLYTLAKL